LARNDHDSAAQASRLKGVLTGRDLMLLRGDRVLFRRLNFEISAGELLLLEGRNGSGKTSLLRAIVGLLHFEEGELLWQGQAAGRQRQEFSAATAWLAHRNGLKPDLTPIENLRFESALAPVKSRDVDAALERLGVLRLRKLPVRALSAGQQRRVAFARMLLSAAPLWLLDEPYTNLDREGRDLVTGIVAEHVAAGGMCMLAAHQEVELDVPVQRLSLS
jgi:heme exporter protein A